MPEVKVETFQIELDIAREVEADSPMEDQSHLQEVSMSAYSGYHQLVYLVPKPQMRRRIRRRCCKRIDYTHDILKCRSIAIAPANLC